MIKETHIISAKTFVSVHPACSCNSFNLYTNPSTCKQLL